MTCLLAFAIKCKDSLLEYIHPTLLNLKPNQRNNFSDKRELLLTQSTVTPLATRWRSHLINSNLSIATATTRIPTLAD
ncbi:hypothetical protein RRG12_08750 [Nostoc sp. CALU 546]